MKAVVVACHSRIEFLDFDVAAWSQVPNRGSLSRGIIKEECQWVVTTCRLSV